MLTFRHMVGVGWTTAGGDVCSDGLMLSPLPLRLKTLSDIRTSKDETERHYTFTPKYLLGREWSTCIFSSVSKHHRGAVVSPSVIVTIQQRMLRSQYPVETDFLLLIVLFYWPFITAIGSNFVFTFTKSASRAIT